MSLGLAQYRSSLGEPISDRHSLFSSVPFLAALEKAAIRWPCFLTETAKAELISAPLSATRETSAHA